MGNYSDSQFLAIYELGRLYYQMGFSASAEKIFSGLVAVRSESVNSLIGLGLVRLERGLFSAAFDTFRLALNIDSSSVEAKIGMAVSAVALKDFSRAQVILSEIQRESFEYLNRRDSLRMIVESFLLRAEIPTDAEASKS